ncbi:hypothetical protein MGG_16031 [Pyricularia oryzae 70-15]|uniref:Uncharacterized protein n=1 Tax=Pyricularia oryzae (strain 70-15 / ATCC MYA-4617 / FGSC 8958) TaxID=242507 RepID=G4MNB3_PYRO7|nr:uncharacterized protein MGG_16031 [Pyricularia oryzae 70-15]EHA56236.1 hypothetical protein MGG_16031 [Pyricularia oryzae 70-15]
MAHQFDQYEIINLERVNEENAKELLSKLSQNLCKTPSIGRRDQICDPTSLQLYGWWLFSAAAVVYM